MNEESSTLKDDHRPQSTCPLCTLMNGVCGVHSKYSGFFTHLINAKVEFLQACKSLIDARIETLERMKKERGESRKATKIHID
jgi:hypothetical protein